MTLRRKRGGLRRTPLRRVPLAAAKHEREESRRRDRQDREAARLARRRERRRKAREVRLLERRLERARYRANRDTVLRESRGVCQRCHRQPQHLEVHHLVPRARAPRWPGLHDTKNLAALCRGCHRAIHAAAVPDWRRWILPPPTSGTWSRTG